MEKFLGPGRGPAWHNDTLSGRLYEFEREEEKHLRNSFGYWHMVEMRMIRNQMIAEGWDPNDIRFHVEASNRRDANHANDFSSQECLGWATKFITRSSSNDFTREELQYLIERFEYANDEVGRSIHAKALAKMQQK